MKYIFAISGKAGSGKDTCGLLLSKLTGLNTLAFGHCPKKVLELILGSKVGTKTPKERKLITDFCDSFTNYDPMFWVNKVMPFIPTKGTIITDLRKRIELQTISKLANNRTKVVTIRVNRPSWHNPNMDEKNLAHPTETELDDYYGFDYIITNDSTLEKLEKTLQGIVDEHPGSAASIQEGL